MASYKLSLCNSSFFQTKKLFNFFPKQRNYAYPSRSLSVTSSTSPSFTWEDVLKVSLPTNNNDTLDNDSLDLHGFFQRIQTCNRGSEKKFEFFPFVIDRQIVGYIHKEFAENLREFKDVFVFGEDSLFGSDAVTLNRLLETPDDRTEAVGYVVKCLGEGLIPGIRNELYPVTSSYGMPVCFSLERAAAPYFGIKAYGVHMNGYANKDGEKFLWIGKRSEVKPTYPGMLDHLVAGGLPHNITCEANIMKECEEEAGIPRSISKFAVSVGAVSYVDIDGPRYKRDVLFCYDLELSDGYVPSNQDGEVGSFKMIPVNHVANIIRRTEFFKPNCCLVIIDFLIRHGFIRPEHRGYLTLLQSLKNGDFS